MRIKTVHIQGKYTHVHFAIRSLQINNQRLIMSQYTGENLNMNAQAAIVNFIITLPFIVTRKKDVLHWQVKQLAKCVEICSCIIIEIL